jgi:hypothetical protein
LLYKSGGNDVSSQGSIIVVVVAIHEHVDITPWPFATFIFVV